MPVPVGFCNTREKGEKPGINPLNALCPYYTMFPIDYPLNVLRKGYAGQWVLDPFCGRGTTTLAARAMGMNTVSNDINPVALAITSAKLENIDPSDVIEKAKTLLSAFHDTQIPIGEYWDLAFHRNTLKDLCSIREGLIGKKDPLSNALRGIVLGVLHGPINKTHSYMSNQMQRTFAPKPGYAVNYWKRNGLHPPNVNVLDVIRKKAERAYSVTLPETYNIVTNQDARRLQCLPGSVDYIITSPPYPGMKTYGVDQWLRQWFIGGPHYPRYDEKGCIGFSGIDNFISSLAMVWERCSVAAKPGCVLSVRLGSFGKRLVDCSHLMQESIQRSGSRWIHRSTTEIGAPLKSSSRQAGLMGDSIKSSAQSDYEFIYCYA